MSWGSCGVDSKGRNIGYSHEGTCDHLACGASIDRGLAFACGGQHGENDYWCEGYFCAEHLVYTEDPNNANEGSLVCYTCLKFIETEEVSE